MSMMKRQLGVLVVSACAAVAMAGEIRPSSDFLKNIQQPPAAPAEASGGKKLKADLEGLVATIGTLPPDVAAQRWLALAEQQREAWHHIDNALAPGEMPLRFSQLMEAFPTSAQLPALKAELDKLALDQPVGQRAAFLKMLIARLQNDPKAMDAAFDDLRKAALARKSPPARIDARFKDFRAQLANPAEQEKNEEVESFTRQLSMQLDDTFPNSRTIYVPDLVTKVGAKKAEELLTRAIKANRILDLSTGDETAKLARKVALDLIDTSKRPQWQLCASLDAVELYEATLKKFPPTPAATQKADADLSEQERMSAFLRSPQTFDEAAARDWATARTYYALALVARGRSDEAFAAAGKLSVGDSSYRFTSAINELTNKGYSKEVYQFLKRVVEANPQTTFWSTFVTAAAKSGHADEVLGIAREIAARPGMSAAANWASHVNLLDALLAADQVDEAVGMLQKDAQASDNVKDNLARYTRLATIGRVMKRPELAKESLDRTVSLLNSVSDSETFKDQQDRWINEMRLAGRTEELSKQLGEWAVKLSQSEERSNYSVPTPLLQLLEIYYQARQPGDVLNLLDNYPAWGKGDLVDLPNRASAHDNQKPVAFYGAWALLQSGRREEGMKALRFVLDRQPGLDAAYVLLLQIDPDATAKLDQMFAKDPFEERPLVWKAVLQRNAGKLDEAEQTLKQAISIDPSDGEEGKGDRMRVYSVLAEVLADKGDAAGAETFKRVVQSIRLSEDADDAWEGGLLTRAISMYKEALGYFADAYCIQSRLAVHLASIGREAEAEEHYRRAYELMPDSFGRVESHCFGCEGAFESAKAQGIADRVFQQLLIKSPKKPQLHYLMGYLRSQQERYHEALQSYQEAVRLDRKYLNAWKKLLDCDSHLQLDDSVRDEATFAIMSLDPLARHGSVDVQKIRDLPRLYAALCTAAAQRTPKPTSIYPLKSSANQLAADEKRNRNYSFFTDFDAAKSPGEVIARHSEVSPILQWIEQYGG
jgi:tetratricopeptide (TPR) repeat protein